MSTDEIALNGWTAVPVDAAKIFPNRPYLTEPTYVPVDSIKFPSDDPIVAKAQEHAKTHLKRQTYNHSMRVFYWASVMAQQQFPKCGGALSPSTLALTCLMHDLGTTEENITSTRMSFEFQGGMQALNLLTALGGARDQAEAVCETTIRHQDLGTDGMITFLGQLIQLATIYDNVGAHPRVKDFGTIIDAKTRDEVNRAWPREAWLGCFADTVRREESLKPWCHTTHIPNFAAQIEGNELMKPYE